MSRRLAHRPRHQHARIIPQPAHRLRQEYLRQRWTYRQQNERLTRPALGYGLTSLPWGWRIVRDTFTRRA